MSGLNWGQIAGVLGATIGAGAIQGRRNANQYNDYAESLNQQLGPGYTIPTKKRSFMLGDRTFDYQALANTYKNQMTQRDADSRAGIMGLQPGAYPPEVVNAMFEKQWLPSQLERMKLGYQMEAGNTEAQTMGILMQYPELFAPITNPQPTPTPGKRQLPGGISIPQGIRTPGDPLPYDPVSTDPNAGGTLQGQVGMTAPQEPPPPPMPPEYLMNLPGISPQTLRSVIRAQGDRYTQGIQQNRLDFDQSKWDEQRPYRNAQLENVKTRTDATRSNAQANMMRAKAQAAYQNARARAGAGRSPSLIEVWQEMLKKGWVTREQFIQKMSGGGANRAVESGDDALDAVERKFGGGSQAPAPSPTPKPRPTAAPTRNGSPKPATTAKPAATTRSTQRKLTPEQEAEAYLRGL